MNFLKQALATTRMSLLSLPSRIGPSLVTIIGVTCSVAIIVSLLSLSEGLTRAIQKNDAPDVAVVLSSRTPSESMGAIAPAEVDRIAAAPGIKRGPDGNPIVQPLAMIVVDVSRKRDGGSADVVFRGTGSADRLMRPKLHIVAGRSYTRGLREIVVGRAAERQFRGLDIGDRVALRGSTWTVVGIYEDNGGIDENAIAGDVDTVLSAFGRTAYQSVDVQLVSANAFPDFKRALESDPQVNVTVKRLSDYYRDQVRQLNNIYEFVGSFVGAILALGAIFGALGTMYSAVERRGVEIATLRALGFSGTAVGFSVLVEAITVALPGAGFGGAIAALFFHNTAVASGGVLFSLAVTSRLIGDGALWALVVGVVGGFFPSMKAARLPIVAALRRS